MNAKVQNTYEGDVLNVKLGQKMLRMIIDYHLKEKIKYNNIEMKITLFDDKFILILQSKVLVFCRTINFKVPRKVMI